MRIGFLCMSFVLLLCCGKAQNAPDTPTTASDRFDEMPTPVTDKTSGAPSRSVIQSEQPAKAINVCMVQGGRPLQIMPIRAVGTEPFWGVQIEGRCVQYSHIEDQKGKRIWTLYTRNETGDVWSGELNGKAFELRLRNEPTCSDGMSDKRYPLSVDLQIGKVILKGCAEPNLVRPRFKIQP